MGDRLGGVIYGLYCECNSCTGNQIRYIGQTQQSPQKRLNNHRSLARFGVNTPVYHWIRKHGPENIRILDVEWPTDGETLDECERRVIATYGLDNLLNIAVGGVDGGTLGRKRPEFADSIRGEKHFRSALTDEQVLEIRSSYRGSHGEVSLLASKYGVSITTISDILLNKIWTHLPSADVTPKKRRRLTEDEVRDIRSAFSSGVKMRDLSNLYGVTFANVSHIVNRKTWKHVD